MADAPLRFVRPAPSTRLPTVLSRDEVRQILGLVRIRVYRECLTTIYAGGLRLLEGARIQIADIDSGRMLLHIHGKGGGRDVCRIFNTPTERCTEFLRPGVNVMLERPPAVAVVWREATRHGHNYGAGSAFAEVSARQAGPALSVRSGTSPATWPPSRRE